MTPPGPVSRAVKPAWNPLPLTAMVCGVPDAGGLAGVMPLIAGAGLTAPTVNGKRFDVWLSGLITCNECAPGLGRVTLISKPVEVRFRICELLTMVNNPPGKFR